MEEYKIKRLAEIKDRMLKDKAERKQREKEAWDNLPKFKEVTDIPNLPHAEPEVWKNYYVPRLIEAGAIPKKDLIHDAYYIGDHRTGKIAKWDNNEKQFLHNRYKFGQTFLDPCNHFEDDNGFALFVPIRLATDDEIKTEYEKWQTVKLKQQ